VANFWDLYWVLDDEQQRLLLRLTPSPFGDDRGAWGLSLAETYDLRGDAVHARAYADSSRIAMEQVIAQSPGNGSLRLYHGLALAYLGRFAEAVKEGEIGAAQVPIERDAYTAPYLQHQLARIYLRAGQPDKAIDILQRLVRIPYYLTPAWLGIDPEWKPLRSNPRFQALLAAKS
jgi:tetratricopeptide (TPR) repeat protein